MIEELKSFSILFFQRCSNQGHINTTLKMLIWVILWKELIFDHFVLLKKVSCTNWMVLDDLRRFSEQIKYHIINNTTKELFGDGFFYAIQQNLFVFFSPPSPTHPIYVLLPFLFPFVAQLVWDCQNILLFHYTLLSLLLFYTSYRESL